MEGYSDRMISRVCVCCGEPMPEEGRALAQNPNLCAACATIVDRLEDASTSPLEQPIQPGRGSVAQPDQMREAA
jgi:RNA polymerase-binding transcription factor DksA